MTATLEKLGCIIPTDEARICDHLGETIRRMVERAECGALGMIAVTTS